MTPISLCFNHAQRTSVGPVQLQDVYDGTMGSVPEGPTAHIPESILPHDVQCPHCQLNTTRGLVSLLPIVDRVASKFLLVVVQRRVQAAKILTTFAPCNSLVVGGLDYDIVAAIVSALHELMFCCLACLVIQCALRRRITDRRLSEGITLLTWSSPALYWTRMIQAQRFSGATTSMMLTSAIGRRSTLRTLVCSFSVAVTYRLHDSMTTARVPCLNTISVDLHGLAQRNTQERTHSHNHTHTFTHHTKNTPHTDTNEIIINSAAGSLHPQNDIEVF